MGYVFDPAEPFSDEIRRVAGERLDDAIGHLDAIGSGDAGAVEAGVHQARKRCKELRGLARLVRPALGDDFRVFDRTVKEAANELSAMRDAHALLVTLDHLLAAQPDGSDELLATVRAQQAEIAAAATASVVQVDGERRIERARMLLADALANSRGWAPDPEFDAAAAGLTATYRRGRRELRRCLADPTDHGLHEWRKAVKYLWYQLRLLQDASPSVIGPMVDQLDDLAEALGDDHDLAVFVAQLGAEPDLFGPSEAVAHARSLARDHQELLRHGALRTGAVVYAEKPTAFVQRVQRYWTLAVERGPERRTGGIAAIGPPATDEPTEPEPAPSPTPSPTPPEMFERERTFLVDRLPAELGEATELRQGYLAIDDHRTTRVRDAGGCTLTVKLGRGAERIELEWPISREVFDAAWPHTAGRRVVKSRYRLALDEHVVDLDVFAGALDGLVLAEVEFASMRDLGAFEPPAWFGPEVTDDDRYSNVALACDGRPPT